MFFNLRKLLDFFSYQPTPIPPAELQIFELLKDEFKVIFDVGCRTDVSYYDLHPSGEYHLFEPNSSFVAELKRKIALLPPNKISVNNFGLSDTNQDNCVYYERSQSFLINPTIGGDVDTGKKFSIRKLDDYVDQHGIKKIDFLKIDTEGFDYKVFQGGRKSLKKVRFLQFEYWDGVEKFYQLLGLRYDLFLMMEPALLRAIQKIIWPKLTKAEQKLKFSNSLLPLTKTVQHLIDTKFIPAGCGGNILGISKQEKFDFRKLIFSISTP